ncbi:hypothetical protein [Moellerella wisconsensis]|uniref:Uncharacterized protein n=1 Tax=Moellerella wisconsensis TaxID=158849 RepID=A0A9Q8Q225_9GAMM|nr:hypothetical protein [Moellerella wisconsensis]UNH30837.1 hypothetical protein MNY72_00460 [Moellerella wisconsensis]
MINIGLLRDNELRVLIFYRNYLVNIYGGNTDRQIIFSDNVSHMKSIIHEFISVKTKSQTERDKLVHRLNRGMNENIIPTDELSWVFKSIEITSFIWGYIVLRKDENDKSVLNMDARKIPNNAYKKMGGELYPASHENRVKVLIFYFDNQWILSKGINSYKLIEQLIVQWNKLSENAINFKWLSIEDSNSINWAFDYLKKYHETEAYNGGGINSFPIFNPVNLYEKKLAIYSILRLWSCHHSEKTLLISNMNKAWQQRKLRHERTTKKAINCYVDIEVKKKLDELVKDSGFQMNYVLADLINRAHDIKFSTK